LILTGLIILGEMPSPAGIAGILLVFAGGYFIFLAPSSSGIFGPFKALAKERGTLAMLGVALIFAFTSALGKKAILLSSPLGFASIYFLLLAGITGIILAAAHRRSAVRAFGEPAKGFIIGAVLALSIASHVYAIAMVKAAYFISVKRLSLVFGILYGWLLFSEEGIVRKLAAGLIMVAGVAVINLWGG
jgi:drug/metabolite transporter (DMT)-like permease